MSECLVGSKSRSLCHILEYLSALARGRNSKTISMMVVFFISLMSLNASQVKYMYMCVIYNKRNKLYYFNATQGFFIPFQIKKYKKGKTKEAINSLVYLADKATYKRGHVYKMSLIFKELLTPGKDGS